MDGFLTALHKDSTLSVDALGVAGIAASDMTGDSQCVLLSKFCVLLPRYFSHEFRHQRGLRRCAVCIKLSLAGACERPRTSVGLPSRKDSVRFYCTIKFDLRLARGGIVDFTG